MRSTLCSLLLCLCTLPLFAQGDTLTFSFSDQGYDRSYIVYVPEAYDGTEEWPVVFNFHGYSINGSVQMLWTGMNAVADTAHFLLVYPDGLLMRNTNPALAPQGPGWNAGSDSDTIFFSTQPVDEATFVSNLIDEVAANFNVDLRRVYTTGWSNGGMQSTVLACELSDRIAAAAPIGAAGDEGRPCNPERIMPILYTHGTADPLVHYEDGGANPNFWGIPDYLAFWADMKGCAPVPDTVMVPDTDTTDSSTVEIITWNDCSSPLIHHRIVGGGHTWSGGPPLVPDFVGPINQDINSGAEVWKFFKQFEHPNPRTAQVIPDTLQLSFTHEGVERTYIIYVPAAYDGSEPWPLVMNFHGYAINGFTQMVWSDMNPVADTAGFLVVYPDGRPVVSTTPNIPPEGLGWNVSVPEDTFFVSVESVDEVKYTNALLDHIAGEFSIDPARVYATGWSNGGMMASVLACELSDRIAAIAPVGATGSIDRPCNPDRIMPILYTHGTDDLIFSYSEGSSDFLLGVPDYLDFWADLKECAAMPDTTMVPDTVSSDSTTVDIITWNDCSSELIHHRVVGGGHNWSGGSPAQPGFLGFVNRDIHSSVEAWRFFSQFEHPNPRTAQVIPDTLVSGDSTRTYLLYVPASYDGSEDWPLVINYHGFTNSSEFQMALSDMNAVADTGQFLVAYPQGLLVENPFNGQTAPGWNIFGTLSDNDDVAFTSDLIDHIAADYTVDLSRVYATGWSMGANMSYDLACQLSDRIAAFAPVANQMSEMQITTCSAERSVPMLQMHGTADPIVPYNGAVFPSGMDSFLVATRTAGYWADLNGCSPTADTSVFTDMDTSDQSTVTVYANGDCNDGADVLFYEITGGGHAWPGGAPLPDFLGPVNRDIHASSEIWNFFNRQTHPSPRVPQLLADTLISSDSTRTYLLYVPAAYDGSEDWPLILDYHGFTGTSEDQVYVGQWETVADTAHFLVAFPQGLSVFDPLDEIDGLGWNITGDLADHDDVAFASDLISRIQDQYNVDSDRIFASGLSMGGEMALALACGLSDQIAAVASVSSPMTTALTNACSPDRSVPVLQMHGTEDPIIPIEGITIYPPAIETAQFWAQSNGCAANPDTTALEDTNPDVNSDILLLTYPNCADNTEVHFYQINGGGNQWPGGGPLPPSFVGNQNLDIHASVEIWNFFNRNPLPDPLVDTREPRSEDVHWQVYPNPFRNQIQVELSLTQKANVTVSLQNLLGQPLWQSNRQQLTAGDHHLAYELQKQLPEGMYVLQLRIDDTVSSRLLMHNQ